MTAVMSERYTAVVGAFLVALGPVSLALYTPAMPVLVEHFGTSAAAIKLTITFYFIGYAVAQLICGPLSDAYGRRPVAFAFFLLHVVGSLLCVASPSIVWLLAGRVLQGVGAAAGIAIARAMVRDQFVGQSSVRIMNLIGLMLAIGPAIAPILGGLTLTLFNWRALFMIMVAYGIAATAVLAFAVRETNRSPDRAMARPAKFLRGYRTIFSDVAFLRAGLVLALMTGGIYTLAALLPFIMIDEVGLSPAAFGFGMLVQSGSYAFGSFLTGRLLSRYGPDHIIVIGLCFTIVSAVCFSLTGLTDPHFLTIMVPAGIWAMGLALIMPGATTRALADFPHMAGAAAAVIGFLQIGGGLAGSAVAALFTDPVDAVAVVLPVMGILALALHVGLRFGERRTVNSPEAVDRARAFSRDVDTGSG
jgi:DHA1 family bicyclomycin/chloramphenicol resistance-like MFS transporter